MSVEVSVKVSENGKGEPTYSLGADTNGQWTIDKLRRVMRENLIRISKAVLAEEQMRGFPKDVLTVVDNSSQKSVNQVLPFGKIQFIRKIDVSLNLLPIYDYILSKSPVDTAQYITSHYVFYNGKLVARNRDQLSAWLQSKPFLKPRDTIRFVNVMPYARSLEHKGITAQRRAPKLRLGRQKYKGQRMMVASPNGVYALASKLVKRFIGRNTYVAYEVLPGPSIGVNAQNTPAFSKSGKPLRRTYSAAGRWAKKDKKTGATSEGGPYLYPTIRIYLREGVIL